ncbi:MAG: hypothetical protein IT337_12065 [Thermomicrobiales bacterium]|nr:hypothetical protein [Thermomicrobiales bacterium]
MDSAKFDRLTRVMGSHSSRRVIARGLAAAALGGAAVATIGRRETAAACAEPGSDKRCNKDNDCCGDDVRCRNHRCTCKSGFRVCRDNGKDRCVDRRTDSNHCGRCGRRCRKGQTCERGRCRTTRCTITGPCGTGKPECCAGFACRAGRPELGLGGCVRV